MILEEIQQFLDYTVGSSFQGLMAKMLKKDATYKPSKRSHNCLNLKKDYMGIIGDLLDLVAIAAFHFHGKAKRTGLYGAFHFACYDNDKKEFLSIFYIGTGFSATMLEECFSSLGLKVIVKPESYYRYSDAVSPNIWFEPSEVWEVKTVHLTVSPHHRAAVGIVNMDKGIK